MADESLDITCVGCRAALRIPSLAAGGPIRCPACGATFAAPSSRISAPPLSHSPAPVPAPTPVLTQPQAPEALQGACAWSLRTPEGLEFGPVDRATLERWVREGRVTGECHVRASTGEWCRAELEFPALAAPLVPAVPRAGTAETATRETPRPTGETARLADVQRLPHRGPLILTLALVGLLVQCPVFSIMAWVMGSADLDEMARGRMDPTGGAITRAGRNLGLVLSVFWIIMSVILVAGLIFVVAVQAAPRPPQA